MFPSSSSPCTTRDNTFQSQPHRATHLPSHRLPSQTSTEHDRRAATLLGQNWGYSTFTKRNSNQRAIPDVPPRPHSQECIVSSGKRASGVTQSCMRSAHADAPHEGAVWARFHSNFLFVESHRPAPAVFRLPNWAFWKLQRDWVSTPSVPSGTHNPPLDLGHASTKRKGLVIL